MISQNLQGWKGAGPKHNSLPTSQEHSGAWLWLTHISQEKDYKLPCDLSLELPPSLEGSPGFWFNLSPLIYFSVADFRRISLGTTTLLNYLF